MRTELQERLQASLAPSYALEYELGGGGMARVFVATETALRRRVVVKVLPPEATADISIERFRREIQLAAGLQHPHIVPVLAAGLAGDILYYTMPLVDGESLRAKLAREGQLLLSETLRILCDVAEALVYAHAHGLVHRDIKPDNILISGNHALVTDFGVAKAVSAATVDSTLTTAGIALGTPAYMAPEQAAGETDVDARADLYALGCTAYEMLCGHTPFTGVSTGVKLLRITGENCTLGVHSAGGALSAWVSTDPARRHIRRPSSSEPRRCVRMGYPRVAQTPVR
jgi:serine/threonine protein kinase